MCLVITNTVHWSFAGLPWSFWIPQRKKMESPKILRPSLGSLPPLKVRVQYKVILWAVAQNIALSSCVDLVYSLKWICYNIKGFSCYQKFIGINMLKHGLWHRIVIINNCANGFILYLAYFQTFSFKEIFFIYLYAIFFFLNRFSCNCN